MGAMPVGWIAREDLGRSSDDGHGDLKVRREVLSEYFSVYRTGAIL